MLSGERKPLRLIFIYFFFLCRIYRRVLDEHVRYKSLPSSAKLEREMTKTLSYLDCTRFQSRQCPKQIYAIENFADEIFFFDQTSSSASPSQLLKLPVVKDRR